MTRKTEGWEIRLTDLIESRRGLPFKRGVNDCVLFAADAVETMTGHNVRPAQMPEYKTREQALEYLKSLGYVDYAAAATAKLGPKLKSTAFAGRGDCVLIEFEGERALGIVDLSGRRTVTIGKDGLVHYAPKYWIDAWKV